jgi:hypothetical protein
MSSPKLVVFLHVAIKQRALQGLLQGVLPAITVIAVGRTADFERSMQDGADAVLTLPLVMSAKGLNAKLRGQHQGASDEKYGLVGADSSPDPARVAAVGALDLLGREGTTKFVHDLLGGHPRVERVTKVEDLLPLLQMQRVEGILLPTRLVPEIQTMSRLKLVQRELSVKVGLPALAISGPGGAEILTAVSKLPREACAMLGVDEWR